jgi:hypothetical protein
MPMMNELLEKLQAAPPATEEELRAALEETGYDLIMKEPGGEPEEAPMGEEVPEEAPEEPPPEGVADEGEIAEEGMDMLKGLFPSSGPPSPEGMSPRMKMKVMTIKAAGKALKGAKGRK